MRYGEPLDEIAYRINQMAVEALLECAVDPPRDGMATFRSFTHPDGWRLFGAFDDDGPIRLEWVAACAEPCSMWDMPGDA